MADRQKTLHLVRTTHNPQLLPLDANSKRSVPVEVDSPSKAQQLLQQEQDGLNIVMSVQMIGTMTRERGGRLR